MKALHRFLLPVLILVLAAFLTSCGATKSNTATEPHATKARPLCQTANIYTWYVTSMAGTNGIQPSGESLKIALDRTTSAIVTIAEATDGSVKADAQSMSTFWKLFQKKWAKYDYGNEKVEQKDIASFQIPGYKKQAQHMLDWSVATCSKKIKPFPQIPD